MFWALGLGLIVGAATLVPLSIPYDGHEYVRSGFAVLDGQMVEHYQWVREPGYPVFVAVLLKFGGPAALIAVQALLLLAAGFWLAGAVNRVVRPWGWSVGPLPAFGAVLLIWGYAACVLQQSVLLAGVALATNGLVTALSGRRGWIGQLAGAGVALGLVSAIVALSVLLAVSIVALIGCRSPRAGHLLRAGATLAVAIMVVTIPWYAVKARSDLSRSDAPGLANFWNYTSMQPPLSERLTLTPSTVFALSSAGAEFNAMVDGTRSAPAKENRLFGLPEFSVDQPCTRDDVTTYAHLPPFTAEAMAATSRCVPATPLAALSRADHYLGLALPLLATLGLLALIAVLTALAMGRTRPVIVAAALVPWVSVAPYAYSGAAISRYGLPALVLDLLCIPIAVSVLRRGARAGATGTGMP